MSYQALNEIRGEFDLLLFFGLDRLAIRPAGISKNNPLLYTGGPQEKKEPYASPNKNVR
jgi:hypothetical protein